MATTIFLLTLLITFAAALVARRRAARGERDEDLAGRKLNRWLVGLSAATTGNSGFIVTGAVGLGYTGGVQWLLLPLSWLLGDLVFWALFPARMNEAARRTGATTISELLKAGLKGWAASLIGIVVSLLLIIFLSVYTSAQWMAGKKFLSGIYELNEVAALVVFGLTIVAYSALGGFRGSIYTDTVQAIIRIVGTIVAIGAVALVALSAPEAFHANIAAAGEGFLSPMTAGGWIGLAGFVGGYACASLGFGLGQPQIVNRYFAGASPDETKAAMWIYIGFLQFTWLAMTAFGVVLRGIMPNIDDPETGLSLFFRDYMGPILTGIIFADVYATIASTSNGILVAIGQSIRHDLLGRILGPRRQAIGIVTIVTFTVGLATILLSFALPGNVFSLAISAVSMIGGGLAGPVMIKLLRFRHTAVSLLAAIVCGALSAFVWTRLGYSSIFNEAGIGLAVSLIVNAVVGRFGSRAVY